MDIVERYCEGEEAGTLIKEARDEIARLRDELTAARKTNSEWLAANGPGGWINDLRDENEALASNLRGKHATTGATYAHLIAERDSLRDENARLSALLLWALYHHQGGSSEVGQPIRRALGIGQYDPLTPSQIEMAKSAAMPAEPAPEEPRVMARFDDGRPMMTYHRAAMQKGE